MKKFSGPLARRYGTALFEAVTDLSKQDKSLFESYSDSIRKLKSLISKEVVSIFNNKTITHSQKNELISSFLDTAIPQLSKEFKTLLSNFFDLVTEKDRFVVIHSILDFFLDKSDKYLSLARAIVYSTRPLSKNSIEEFSNIISNTIGKKLLFSNEIDESLRSGFLIKIGNINVDASLKTFLSQLKQSIQ